MKIFVVIVTCLGLAGCAGTPTVQTGPDAEVTYDGLHRVDNSVADHAWAKPDIDISQYSKIILLSAGIEYRPVKSSRTSVRLSDATEFPLTDAQRKKLEESVSEAFRDELGKSEHFDLTTEPGVDVLVVVGKLIDVVSNVPPERIGRSEVYLETVGEATLVLEIRDSISYAMLARVVDRRAAERASGFTLSSSVNNWAEVRQVARAWASLLRRRLDEAHGY